MLKVSVIIPNWNGKELLKICLKSLIDQNYKNLEVFVVDNGSTDGTVEFINFKFKSVKIIRNKINLGFARAVNQGIKLSTSDFIVLLNNDTRLDSNFLGTLVQSLRERKEVSAVAPKVLSFSNPEIIDSAGDFMNVLGQAFPRGRSDSKENWNQGGEVFLVNAGASIYRRVVFEKVGLFEEDFFAYGEDVDWCFRAQLCGFKFWYEPNAIVYHHHKATARRIPKKVEYLQFRNMTMTIIRDFPIGLFLRKLRFILIPLVHLNAILYMAVHGFFKQALMADLWIFFHILKILKDRRSILSNREVSIDYLDKWMVPKKFRLWGILR